MVDPTKIREHLDREHPRLFTEKYGWLYLAVIAFFIALIINHQQPYGLYTWHDRHKWIIISGFGIVPVLVYGFIFELLPHIFSHYFAKNSWTQRKELIALLIFFFTAGMVNWLFALLALPYFHASAGSFFRIELYTLEAGIFPVLLLFSITIIKQEKQIRQGLEGEMNQISLQPPTPLAEEIMLRYNNLHFELNKLIYATKSGNYLHIYVEKEGEYKQLKCVGSIKDLLLELTDHRHIVQTHQSFLVNVYYIKDWKGNSNGMNISLKNCPHKITVSRQYVECIKEVLITL